MISTPSTSLSSLIRLISVFLPVFLNKKKDNRFKIVTIDIAEGSPMRARCSGPEGLLSEAAGNPAGGGRGRGDGEDRSAGEVERAPGTSRSIASD